MALIDNQVLKLFEKHGVRPIDEYDKEGIYWFCIKEAIPKVTKNKKNYLLLSVVGSIGKQFKIFMWSWDGVTKIPTFSVCYAEMSKSDFGFATSLRKVKVL